MSDNNGAPMTDDELDEPADAAERITRPPPSPPWGAPAAPARERKVGVRDPNSKAGRIRGVIQALGPGCTVDAVRAELPDMEVHVQDLYKARGQVYPHLRRGYRRVQPAPAPAVPPPRESNAPSPTTAREPADSEEIGEIDLGPDWLSKLVKLACAVEAVGGVPTARRLLDAIETVRGRRL